MGDDGGNGEGNEGEGLWLGWVGKVGDGGMSMDVGGWSKEKSGRNRRVELVCWWIVVGIEEQMRVFACDKMVDTLDFFSYMDRFE